MFHHLFRYAPWNSQPEERKKELLTREGGLSRAAAISQHTSIAVTNHNGKKFSEEENDILKRFGMFSSKPIPVSSICKKQKHRQEKHKFNWHWKEYGQEPWPCRRVMNFRSRQFIVPAGPGIGHAGLERRLLYLG